MTCRWRVRTRTQQDPGQGIWEVRSGRQEFLYSRVLRWAAGFAWKRSFPAPFGRWLSCGSGRHLPVMGEDERAAAAVQQVLSP